MTSSRKKHHPAGAPAPAVPAPAPARSTSTRTWVIRVLAVLGVSAGAAMAYSEQVLMPWAAGASYC